MAARKAYIAWSKPSSIGSLFDEIHSRTERTPSQAEKVVTENAGDLVRVRVVHRYNAGFHFRSGDGEEETDGACVVEGGCENLKGSGEGKALRASGCEEAGSHAWRSGTEGDGARCEI